MRHGLHSLNTAEGTCTQVRGIWSYGLAHRGCSIEAYANARRLRKLLKLSEWQRTESTDVGREGIMRTKARGLV